MKIHFKLSHWEEVIVPDGKEEEAKEILKNNSPALANSIMCADNDWSWRKLDDTDEFLTPIDNNGNSTVEIIKD